MIIGMDFGTTNSGAAVFDGNKIRLLQLDPSSETPEVCRSAIYMTRTGDYFLGSQALSTYFAQNIGRPTRFRKVWVGEIIQIFAELPVFYRDVFVFEDEFSPGRLFTSIKTALRSRNYYGTAFRGLWYNASDLVAIFLMGMKLQIEKQLGGPVNEVALGRPVHFSSNPEEDEIAQGRLLDAAFKAGFEKVYLEYEPIAAALAYERTVTKPEVILVFDFGGGTLDFTVMEVGGKSSRQVLATGGVPIAGDIFDQRLFRATIPRHLGEGEEFLSNNARRPIPAHLFDTLSQPAEILSLNTPQNLEMLRKIHAGSLAPEKTHALVKVVSSNYALMMFDLVEKTKEQLSSDYLSPLLIDTPDFTIRETVTRATFERAIRHEAESIRAELDATLVKAGLSPGQIDRVIRTGGSSQIPLFVEMLEEIFGVEKVRAIDIFSSVTSGLAIQARQVEQGTTDLPVYTPESNLRFQEQASGQPEEEPEQKEITVKPVELSAIKRRLQVQQEFGDDSLTGGFQGAVVSTLAPANLASPVLFIWNRQRTRVVAVEPASGSINEPLSPDDQCISARLDQSMLIITNQVKLVSARVGDLWMAQQAAEDGIIQSLPLDAEETIVAMLPWNPAEPESELVCLVTRTGQGRAFNARMLADMLAHRPYFQLERRYSGLPCGLLFASPGDSIVLGTDQGRLARAMAGDLSVQALDILRVRGYERLSAWASAPPGISAGVLSSAAGWLVFDPEFLPVTGAPAQRARLLRRDFPIIQLIRLDDAGLSGYYALSGQGYVIALRLVENNAAHLQVPQAKPINVARLAPQDALLGAFRL